MGVKRKQHGVKFKAQVAMVSCSPALAASMAALIFLASRGQTLSPFRFFGHCLQAALDVAQGVGKSLEVGQQGAHLGRFVAAFSHFIDRRLGFLPSAGQLRFQV